jgi:ABC-type dipeptide/oligopeptide/nickel transport system ATPase component
MLLTIDQLSVAFPDGRGASRKAVDEMCLSIQEAEVFGLVGESGSGKTVSSLAILRLLDPPSQITACSLNWRDRDLMTCSEAEMREVRGREIAMIFQNPQASLNPARRIGDQLCDVLRQHRKMSKRQACDESLRLLREVQIRDAERVYRALPRQLSGGMCQRVMIAMAISCQPKLLIADEPTASLDVTVQSEILDLLLKLRDRLGMAILLISHDLSVVAHMCDRIAVMKNGKIVEVGDASQVFHSPKHPYTRLLLDSILVPNPGSSRKHSLKPTVDFPGNV